MGKKKFDLAFWQQIFQLNSNVITIDNNISLIRFLLNLFSFIFLQAWSSVRVPFEYLERQNPVHIISGEYTSTNIIRRRHLLLTSYSNFLLFDFNSSYEFHSFHSINFFAYLDICLLQIAINNSYYYESEI